MFVKQGAVPKDQQVLTALINSRPFIHQLDVVLVNAEETSLLLPLTTSYLKRQITFSVLFEIFDPSFVARMTALSVGDLETEDVWCLDNRGILSLSLTSSTYERLGIPGGTRVRGPGHKFSFLVRLDLCDTSSSLALRSRGCLVQWDNRRVDGGEGPWDVLLSTASSLPATSPGTRLTVNPEYNTISHAHVPSSLLPFIKSDKSDDANEATAQLFEWLGLACLGSQRLAVNDTVNTYSASYDPPQSSTSGSIFHLRWLGFISPAFVSIVMNIILSSSKGIRGISALAFDAPVSRMSLSGSKNKGDDVWSLIAAEQSQDPQDETTCWLLAERK